MVPKEEKKATFLDFPSLIQNLKQAWQVQQKNVANLKNIFAFSKKEVEELFEKIENSKKEILILENEVEKEKRILDEIEKQIQTKITTDERLKDEIENQKKSNQGLKEKLEKMEKEFAKKKEKMKEKEMMAKKEKELFQKVSQFFENFSEEREKLLFQKQRLLDEYRKIIKKEKLLEKWIENLEAKEETAPVQEETSLEKERWEKEMERQRTEAKRWEIEDELKSIEEKILRLSKKIEKYSEILKKQKSFKEKENELLKKKEEIKNLNEKLRMEIDLYLKQEKVVEEEEEEEEEVEKLRQEILRKKMEIQKRKMEVEKKKAEIEKKLKEAEKPKIQKKPSLEAKPTEKRKEPYEAFIKRPPSIKMIEKKERAPFVLGPKVKKEQIFFAPKKENLIFEVLTLIFLLASTLGIFLFLRPSPQIVSPPLPEAKIINFPKIEPPKKKTHTVCQSQRCVVIEGEGKSDCSVDKDCQFFPFIFDVSREISLEKMDAQELLLKLDNEIQKKDLKRGSLLEIVLKKQGKTLSLDEFLQILNLNPPPEIKENLNDYLFYLYFEEGQKPGRISFVFSIKKEKAGFLRTRMPIWEKNLPDDFFNFHKLYGLEKKIEGSFGKTTLPFFEKIPVYYLNSYLGPTLSIDWAIYENVILFTTSRESMLSSINRLRRRK